MSDGEERMYEAAAASGFDVNEHGVWCTMCGNCIAPPWFFDDEDYGLPPNCKCGFPWEM